MDRFETYKGNHAELSDKGFKADVAALVRFRRAAGETLSTAVRTPVPAYNRHYVAQFIIIFGA